MKTSPDPTGNKRASFLLVVGPRVLTLKTADLIGAGDHTGPCFSPVAKIFQKSTRGLAAGFAPLDIADCAAVGAGHQIVIAHVLIVVPHWARLLIASGKS